MADIKELKITEDKTRGKHVADLPVNPTENGMSAQELQGRFDALPKVAIDAFNDLVDALKENGAGDKITPQSVGARPDTWMPTASDVGAMTQGGSSIYKDYTTVLEAARAMPTSGTIFAVEGTNLINAEDSPYPTIEMQYLVLVDDISRRTVVAFRYGAGVENIWVRTIFNDHWMYKGWQEFARMDKVLPRDGSVPMSGNLLLDNCEATVRGNSKSFRLELSNGDLIGYIGGDENAFTVTGFKDSSNITVLSILNPNFLGLNEAIRLSRRVNGSTEGPYNIFGEHNKPSGSYTGNGSATSRTIDTGGIGEICAVWSDTGNTFALVTNVGAICFKENDTTASILSKSSAWMSPSQKINLTTTSEFLNTNGVTYYYQYL